GLPRRSRDVPEAADNLPRPWGHSNASPAGRPGSDSHRRGPPTEIAGGATRPERVPSRRCRRNPRGPPGIFLSSWKVAYEAHDLPNSAYAPRSIERLARGPKSFAVGQRLVRGELFVAEGARSLDLN